MSKKNKKLRGLFAALDRVYAMIPPVQCQLKCGDSCGSIAEAITPMELDRVRRRLKMPDFLFAGDGCGQCPLLDSHGLCSIHDIRPLICRLWGVVKDKLMTCEHGCKGQKISNSDAREIQAFVLELSNAYEIELTELLGEEHGQALADEFRWLPSFDGYQDPERRIR